MGEKTGDKFSAKVGDTFSAKIGAKLWATLGELAGGGSMAVDVGVGDRWQVAVAVGISDIWQLTHDMCKLLFQFWASSNSLGAAAFQRYF